MSAPFELAALFFGPHPDDVELCCGGTVALLASQGHRIAVCDLTRGELASNGTPEQRAVEAERAAAALGVEHRENLGLPDGGIDPSPSAGQVAPVVEVLRRLRPELVFAPSARARHPDHVATHELVTRAVFFAGVARFATSPAQPRFTPRQLVYYQMRGAMEPSFVVDISAVYDAKLRAIACYGSQVVREDGAAATMANAPLSLQALQARDRTHGATIGVPFGEAFQLRGAVPISDPVAHFRAHPAEALFHTGAR